MSGQDGNTDSDDYPFGFLKRLPMHSSYYIAFTAKMFLLTLYVLTSKIETYRSRRHLFLPSPELNPTGGIPKTAAATFCLAKEKGEKRRKIRSVGERQTLRVMDSELTHFSGGSFSRRPATSLCVDRLKMFHLPSSSAAVFSKTIIIYFTAVVRFVHLGRIFVLIP